MYGHPVVSMKLENWDAATCQILDQVSTTPVNIQQYFSMHIFFWYRIDHSGQTWPQKQFQNT